MKMEITILQENMSPLVITDNDDRNLESYTISLSKILDSNNVVMLHTTSCSVIIRPHKINSIIVRYLEKPPTTESKKDENPKQDEINETDDGIITD